VHKTNTKLHNKTVFF